MTSPWIGLSLMLEPAFLSATLPLFEGGEVDVLEWSFDVGWSSAGIPDWAAELLGHFSGAGRLLGHGVTFSCLSGRLRERQQRWLQCLRQECDLRDYVHVSEHFGFMTAGDFHQSAPLPVPRTPETLALGRARLGTLAEACGKPVGLENLAFAFSPDDVAEQGQFLDELLDPVDGFLLLDLHNLYCQLANFDSTPEALLESYPLERVRELHISGGSWVDGIRRDTHDDAVPPEVFELLSLALPRCPNLQAVIFERLGHTIGESDAEQLRADFRRLAELVA